jgi:HAD superfamily hydrolase (TIGR01484 family)
MKHNSPLLLALDVDGTLARPDGTISPRTVEVVKRLQRDGTILCIASGRPPLGIRPVAELLGMDEFGGYIIGYNGGVLIDDLKPGNGPFLNDQDMMKKVGE